jgi:hypothetical protein
MALNVLKIDRAAWIWCGEAKLILLSAQLSSRTIEAQQCFNYLQM